MKCFLLLVCFTGVLLVTRTVAAGSDAECISVECISEAYGQVVSIDDGISVAKCLSDLVVTKCGWVAVSAGARSDGVTTTQDAKECRAHSSYSGGSVKAKACCGRLHGKVKVISNPSIMLNDRMSIPSKAAKLMPAPSVECPSGTELVSCLAHTYWSQNYGTPKAIKSGRKCSTESKCKKCDVQAICLGLQGECGEMKASQSTIHGPAVASRAIDGNTASSYWAGSCTHTGFGGDQDPWLTIDQGCSKQVHSVEIYNRGDCCSHRLSDFQIILSDQLYSSDQRTSYWNVCAYQDSSFRGSKKIACEGTGRYLTIRFKNPSAKPGNDRFLSVCEVIIS